MLSDKNSLILCAVVALGFSTCGIIGVLDNFAVVSVLIVCFLVIIVNIIIVKNKDTESEISNELEDIDDSK